MDNELNTLPGRYRLQLQQGLNKALHNRIGALLEAHDSLVSTNNYVAAEVIINRLVSTVTELTKLSNNISEWPDWEEIPKTFVK